MSGPVNPSQRHNPWHTTVRNGESWRGSTSRRAPTAPRGANGPMQGKATCSWRCDIIGDSMCSCERHEQSECRSSFLLNRNWSATRSFRFETSLSIQMDCAYRCHQRHSREIRIAAVGEMHNCTTTINDTEHPVDSVSWRNLEYTLGSNCRT